VKSLKIGDMMKLYKAYKNVPVFLGHTVDSFTGLELAPVVSRSCWPLCYECHVQLIV